MKRRLLLMILMLGSPGVLVSGTLLMTAGCSRPKTPETGAAYADLQSADPVIVMRASEVAGKAQNFGATPYLISNLRHEEFAIRHSAHMALLMLYHGLPFKFEGPPPRPFGYLAGEAEERAQAVNAWEQWWQLKKTELIEANKAAKEKSEAQSG